MNRPYGQSFTDDSCRLFWQSLLVQSASMDVPHYWARGEATGNLCLGIQGQGAGEDRSFLAGLAGRKVGVKHRCRTVPQSRPRQTAARLPHRLSPPRQCTSHLGFGACLIRPQMDLPERDFTTNPPAMGIKGKGRQDNQLAVVLAIIVLARVTPQGTGKPAAGYAMYATESAG